MVILEGLRTGDSCGWRCTYSLYMQCFLCLLFSSQSKSYEIIFLFWLTVCVCVRECACACACNDLTDSSHTAYRNALIWLAEWHHVTWFTTRAISLWVSWTTSAAEMLHRFRKKEVRILNKLLVIASLEHHLPVGDLGGDGEGWKFNKRDMFRCRRPSNHLLVMYSCF